MPPVSPIRNVVILFKENHPFDNYFGPFPGANGATKAHSPNPPPHDPNHTRKGWLNRATGAVRRQFVESDIPTYFADARQFTLCDNYFADVAGPSTPNHLMVITADSPIIDNPHGNPVYDLPSLPASLDAAGVTWGNYGWVHFEDAALACQSRETLRDYFPFEDTECARCCDRWHDRLFWLHPKTGVPAK